MTRIIIAIDAMGGDHGPPVTVPASLEALAKYPDLHLILVGDQAVLQRALQSRSYDNQRLTIQHASQQVEMDELPSQALRTKKDSSMRVAINLVKEGRAQACVSAGNTGALMATARFVLKTLPGIDRPAIVSTFPTMNPAKNMRMLDLGANVDSSAEHLVQFAVMGSVLASAVDNIENPKVYLLNIGEEEIKGNEQVKQTAQLLTTLSAINYAGYIEGDVIYQGDADVVVCDGFVGNVTLKTTEGVAIFIGKLIKEAFMRNLFTKLAGLMVKPVLKAFVKRIDPARYNGATFIGLQGTVIKSHGGAKSQAFMHAIEEAMIGVEKNVPERIRHEVERLLKNPSLHSESE
ncbi:phosphate acyltransferase PlsX [Aquicella lusitana]|uniref:Phosphate acyltransferase n=1 Tax=Aquicella lusitana TaxID=254246 RepID=A0A370GRH8_9COXI|nr:phosphate acyltransferase PlsX [Aquicella lusitana]RDI46009.1 phosphate:acyl-[acyl carrier protein] acyltransferase [Aquicella lusitana]VVC73394.1 Phosphate acyltransferase [Aquicella lusitana]